MSNFLQSVSPLLLLLLHLATAQEGPNSPAVRNQILEVFNNCKCLFYYQCYANNTINKNGETLIDERFNKEETNSSANSTRIVCEGGDFEGQLLCCRSEEINSNLTITTPAAEQFPTAVSNSPDDDVETESSVQNGPPCGKQRTNINTRILNVNEGNTAIKGEFPWIAAVYKKKKNGKWKFHSSGALINPRAILTANHYYDGASPEKFLVVVNGDVELPKTPNNPANQRKVAEIISHPNYYGRALYYDAALLILDSPFTSNSTNSINTICLPPGNTDENSGFCWVAGWGKGSENSGVRVLKRVELPLVRFDLCQDQLRSTRLGRYFQLHESFVCAGGEEGKDACLGDGGSPLMCYVPGTNRLYHAGIVAWGIGCGMKDVPGVYASTRKVQSWIVRELDRKLSD